MLHNKRRKSKGENRADFKYLHARNDASERAPAETNSRTKNQTGLQNFHDFQFGRGNHENQQSCPK